MMRERRFGFMVMAALAGGSERRPSATSLGADHLARNAGSLVNVAYYPDHWYESDGLLDSLWGQSVVDIEFDPAFNSSRLRLAHVIYDEYRDEYNAIFRPLDPALDPAQGDLHQVPLGPGLHGRRVPQHGHGGHG